MLSMDAKLDFHHFTYRTQAHARGPGYTIEATYHHSDGHTPANALYISSVTLRSNIGQHDDHGEDATGGQRRS